MIDDASRKIVISLRVSLLFVSWVCGKSRRVKGQKVADEERAYCGGECCE